jgi:hypothetical protein
MLVFSYQSLTIYLKTIIANSKISSTIGIFLTLDFSARMCVPKFLFSNIVELRLMIAGSRVAGASSFKDDVLAEPSACVLTAYPLGLLYDPNMTWKTEPAPQPTENLIQEQACALFAL